MYPIHGISTEYEIQAFCQDVENIKHILMQCEQYSDERKSFYIYIERTTNLTITNLSENGILYCLLDNSSILMAVSKTAFKMLQKRNNNK